MGLLAVAATTLATLISAWPILRDEWVARFGSDSEALVPIRARLIAWHTTMDQPEDQDQYFLEFQLRNYGPAPVLLTSADLAIEEAASASIGRAGRLGRCVLMADPDEGRVIRLEAGDEKWIRPSRAIWLPGLSGWFTPERISRIRRTITERPPVLHDLSYVDELNGVLASLFGADARIAVTLYTGRRERMRRLSFALARGKDLFARDGSLAHDTLIATRLATEAELHSDIDAECR